MEIKRYWVGCDSCCGDFNAEGTGPWVKWSDVEPLLTPLTDEQVRKLAYRIVIASSELDEALSQVRDECDAKELNWKEADAAELAAHADYIEDCRAALKEVGR